MSNRIWTFTISKALSKDQLNKLEQTGREFVNQWTAHDQPLSASFSIEKERLLIVKVNESVYQASGCSIDKLTRFIKQLEQEFNVELLNRLLVPYITPAGQIDVIPAASVKTLLQNATLTASTPVYLTSVTSEAELQNWIQPLSETWLKKYL